VWLKRVAPVVRIQPRVECVAHLSRQASAHYGALRLDLHAVAPSTKGTRLELQRQIGVKVRFAEVDMCRPEQIRTLTELMQGTSVLAANAAIRTARAGISADG
jgi:hypothetical protein